MLDLTQWPFIEAGTYNNVYISDKEYTIEGHTCRWVFKQPKKKCLDHGYEINTALNDPERALRKWRLINPTYPAWAIKDGWIAPYLGITSQKIKCASDKQISEKIILIYQATGNIIIDACGLNNFLVSGDDVVCIDVDLALQQDSDASESAFKSIVCQPHFDNYLLNKSRIPNKKNTVEVIKTLLYLDREACDFELKKQHITVKMIDILHVFRETKASLTASTMNMLWQVIQLDPHGEINNRDITPELIMHLEIQQENNIHITQKSVTQLIQYETTRKQQASIANAFLSLCDILPTHDQTLLQTFSSNASSGPSTSDLGVFQNRIKKRHTEASDMPETPEKIASLSR